MCFQIQDSRRTRDSGRGGRGGFLNVSSLYGECLLLCSLCFPTEWEKTSAAVKGGGFPTKHNGKEKRSLGFASARSALQEENLEIRSSPPPLHSFSCSPPYSHPSPQPKNLRAALKPLSVLRRCEMCARSPPRQPPKGVFVQRLVDEVQSVFWAKHAHPLTRGRTPTLTGLRTKITPSCLLCFLLNPLQHMTCVTATDLHWKIRPVEGQGKSPKQRGERKKKSHRHPFHSPFFFDGLFKKFIFLKCLAYFMVL